MPKSGHIAAPTHPRGSSSFSSCRCSPRPVRGRRAVAVAVAVPSVPAAVFVFAAGSLMETARLCLLPRWVGSDTAVPAPSLPCPVPPVPSRPAGRRCPAELSAPGRGAPPAAERADRGRWRWRSVGVWGGAASHRCRLFPLLAAGPVSRPLRSSHGDPGPPRGRQASERVRHRRDPPLLPRPGMAAPPAGRQVPEPPAPLSRKRPPSACQGAAGAVLGLISSIFVPCGESCSMHRGHESRGSGCGDAGAGAAAVKLPLCSASATCGSSPGLCFVLFL